MLILLPAAVLGLLWHLVARKRDGLGLSRLSRRGALMVAYLGFQALLEIITQLTSVGHHFTRGSLIACWSGLLIILLALAWPSIRRALRNTPAHPISTLGGLIRRIGPENAAWLTVVAVILGVLGYLGWSFLPSNGDSLVYHLARVEHWIQDQSVGSFPTHYLAQLELSPLSEFNFAHFQLLAGSDRLDGYVQLLACLICLVAVSEVARLLGGSRWIQVVAVVICATIPSGILVATSTENDYFAAAIGISLIVVVLAWPRDGIWWPSSLIVGIGAGLGYLAKGTVPALIGPVLVIVMLRHFAGTVHLQGVSRAIRRWAGVLGAAAAAALVVSAPFVSQNVSLFGSLTGPISKSTLSTHLTLPAAAANVVRSTASNFKVGNGRSGLETLVSETVLSDLHSLFDQFHVDPKNPNYVLGTETNAFAKADYTQGDRSGDFGADPWNVVLICGSLVILTIACARGDRKTRMALLVAAGLVLGYLFFSGTARWNAFVVRYQIPLYVAWSPVIAIALSKLPKMAARIVLILLVIACLPQLFNNVEEPFFHQQYATKSLAPYFLDTTVQSYVDSSSAEYQAASAAIAETSCHRVGLANWLLVEYPLWMGLKDASWNGEIQNVNVQNVSSRFENSAFNPCVLLRQEGSTYVGEDTRRLQLQFGSLALSIDPQVARTLQLKVHGFHSGISDIRVFPGGGWSLASPSGQPTLTRSGSIYLFSPVRRTVWLHVTSSSSTAQAHAVLSTPGSGPGTTLSSSPGDPVLVSPGITEIRLDPLPNGASAAVSGVEVTPTPSLG